METPPNTHPEKLPIGVKRLSDFDMDYFHALEGADGWVALGQDNCRNQQYFTVYGNNNEKLGIVGVYDTAEEKNITHTIIDPRYRGQGLAAACKQKLMEQLDLPYITMTIDLDNAASIKATEKMSGVKKISDQQYEHEYHKVKYILEKPLPRETS